MSRRALLTMGMIIAATSGLEAQSLRVASLGGMAYAVDDSETSLSLYDFAGNPAWLIPDEPSAWLAFSPSYRSVYGSYRRMYDPGHAVALQAAFDGVKPLGDRGTFRGATAYSFENRHDVYRSLKRAPYSGEAYFVTDTTQGTFTYSGPEVSFTYAYELFTGLFVGGHVDYKLQDGLKDVYTRAKSLYREVEGTAGIAYAFSGRFAAGLTMHPLDHQERLESKSDDLLDVELFNYRGETYAKRRSGSSIKHTVRRTGEKYSAHARWRPESHLDIAMRLETGIRRTRDLITTASEENFEDGFTQRTFEGGAAQVRWMPGGGWTLGAGVQHEACREWSRYTALQLLVWDVRGSVTTLGGGAAFRFTPDGPLAAVQADYAAVHTDSSKHIDARTATVRTQTYRVSAGIELPVAAGTVLRGAYTYGHAGFDVVSGGRDVTSHTLSAGVAIPFSEVIAAEWSLRYTAVSDALGLRRTDLVSVVRCVLLDF